MKWKVGEIYKMMEVTKQNEELILKEQVYKFIIKNVEKINKEIGGILGGYGHTVTRCCIDKGLGSCKCSYIPDTKYLNQVVADWVKEDICFLGIFHTHFFNVTTLSEGDINYIQKIMDAMPDYIKQLYFPIVSLPEKRLTVYMARKTFGKTEILKVKSIIQGE